MLTSSQVKQLRAHRLTTKNKALKARELAGLTQVQLAEALEITQPYVSAIERGDYQDLPLETTRTYAEFFGLPIEDIFPARQEVSA